MDERRDRGVGEASTATVPPEDLEGPDGGSDLEGLAAELDAARAERDSLIDQLQRERADFANFRRRVESERADARQRASRDILTQLLPVMDDFDRAIAAVPPDQPETGWITGTRMVGKKLASVLERAGVTPIPALGERFDPALHEAVATEPGTAGDHVVEVYQGGYRLGGNVLRAAMVKTGDAPADRQDHDAAASDGFQA